MTTALVSLGNQELIRVLSYLDKEDLRGCCQVSSQWRKLASDNSLWSRFYPGITPKPGFTLKEHIQIASKMFKSFPELLEKAFVGFSEKSCFFDETKAEFIDQLSQDNTVTVGENQAWDLMQVTDKQVIKNPSKRRRFGPCTIQ